jgi:hypothetical protein
MILYRTAAVDDQLIFYHEAGDSLSRRMFMRLPWQSPTSDLSGGS